MNVILIGYRCTGKTSVGKRVAELLAIPFYDTDEMIERHVGKTIREMVDEEGWNAFRTKEKDIIKKLPLPTDAIVAAGGGAVMDAENRRVLRRNGLVIWLTADVKTIVERMKKDQAIVGHRPPLSRETLEWETTEVLESRKPLYQELADVTVDTSGKKIDAIADEVLTALDRYNLDKRGLLAT